MNKEELISAAKKHGFTYASEIPVSSLVFDSGFRKYCEKNDCGKYGKMYSCPPLCGSPEELKKRALGYKNALILSTHRTGIDPFDKNAMLEFKKEHDIRMHAFLDEEINKENLPNDGLRIPAGQCILCGECALEKGEPCKNEEKRGVSLSGYCIDVMKMAKEAGIPLSWEKYQASFLSAFLY